MVKGAIKRGISLNTLGGGGGEELVHWWDIMSAQGGNDDARARISRVHRGSSVHWRDTVSTPGDTMMSGRIL